MQNIGLVKIGTILCLETNFFAPILLLQKFHDATLGLEKTRASNWGWLGEGRRLTL